MSSEVLDGSTEQEAPDAGSLSDRVALLTGATSWTLHPLPARDLRALVLSDGPIGVRGVTEDTRPSAQLPSPSAWSATFDRALVRELGALLGREARRKGVDVVLAPVINLQRSPFGGRHFEAFSEDPFLTGEIAVEVVQAAQRGGVAMCVKHFLGNESETERTSYLAVIPERALREVYLAPFERAVKDAGVWTVMAAYNGVDDGVIAAPATEHGSLVLGVLKGEWGFDGVVVSDWLAATTTVESALGGLDLVMPGPDGPWGTALEEAVRGGRVGESVVDDKVERIVRLGRRVGAVGGLQEHSAPADLPVHAETRALLREVVARSTVVLANDGLLPLLPTEVASIALIGPNAVDPFVQGGGSAFVAAPLLSSPIEGIREAFPAAQLSLHRGTSGRLFPKSIVAELVSTPSGQEGYQLTLFDESGRVVEEPRTVGVGEGWNRDIPLEAAEALVQADVHLGPGSHRLQVGVSGAHRILIDGVVVSESERRADHDVILDSSANNPAGPSVLVEVGTERMVRIESRQQVVDAGAYGRFVRFALRHERQVLTPDLEIDQAVEAAQSADVAVVVVGTNEETESEGWDRTTLALPGRQNELVERVLAVNPRTVVVVNAGAPVILPWLDRAAAVLWWWLPGQEAGGGLGDVLTGATEPSGRLPWTLPRDEADVPVATTMPVEGRIEYSEGLHVGYRGWDRRALRPAREFGFGLGYGSWLYEDLAVEGSVDELRARVTVTNVAARDAREVVQLYLEASDSSVERPVRWLAGFATVDVPAGETREVELAIRRRHLETWNTERRHWEIPDGRYLIHAAHSSRDIRLSTAFTITNRSLAPSEEAPHLTRTTTYN